MAQSKTPQPLNNHQIVVKALGLPFCEPIESGKNSESVKSAQVIIDCFNKKKKSLLFNYYVNEGNLNAYSEFEYLPVLSYLLESE